MDFQGIVVLVLAFGMIFYAIPRQVKKNYRDGKCGLDFALIILPFCLYVARAVFAFNKGFSGAWYLYVPDVAGALAGVVLMLQYYGFFLKKNAMGEEK